MARRPRRTREEQLAGNVLRNEVQMMVNRGEIDDPDFIRALGLAREGRQLEDIGGDHFEPVYSPRGAKEGKVFMQAVDRNSGQGESAATLKAMVAAERLKSLGYSGANVPAANTSYIERILARDVMDSSLGTIGSLGVRGTLKGEDPLALARTAALLGDTDMGVNRQTGMAFNAMPLDAGHILAHASNPALSTSPTNIMFENQYMNKGKSAAEKRAFQDGNRQATDEELADSIFNAIISKATSDVTLPRKGKARDAYMAPINAKLGL